MTMNKDVVNILPFIEPGTVGIEIGVWAGDTSEKFLAKNVSHLHLVDSWSVEAYLQQKNPEKGSHSQFFKAMSHYCGSEDPKKLQIFFDGLHDKVQRKFKGYNSVTIHRTTSKQFFETFTDKVDWIYVDGAHSYDECLEDLIASLSVVKPGGWIIGDDYEWTLTQGKPGVTKAVNEFVSSYNLKPIKAGVRQFLIEV